jgi:pyruvate dehydrogenase phosphatase
MMRQLGPRLLHQSHQDEKGVNAALVQSFLAIENAYIDSVKASYKLGFGDVGKVGSCVLVVARKEEDLYVANAGDCRAVLGTRLSSSSSSPSSPSSASSSASGSFAATRLSRDHNARMPTEALALRENHPNEKDIVICKNAHACYVKGRLQVTRSLGDLYLKVCKHDRGDMQSYNTCRLLTKRVFLFSE